MYGFRNLKLHDIIKLLRLRKTTAYRGGADMETKFENPEGNRKKSIFEKAKEHKREIAIGALTVLSVAVALLVVKNKAAIRFPDKKEKVRTCLKTQCGAVTPIAGPIEKSIASNSSNGNIINVKEHIRNLPKNRNPSQSKIELAAKYGYSLEPKQTLVNAYTKTCA